MLHLRTPLLAVMLSQTCLCSMTLCFGGAEVGGLQSGRRLGFVQGLSRAWTEEACFWGNMLFSSHQRGTCSTCRLPLWMLTLVIWLGEGLSGFSTGSYSFLPFPHCPLWKKVTSGAGNPLPLRKRGAPGLSLRIPLCGRFSCGIPLRPLVLCVIRDSRAFILYFGL